MPRGVFKMVHPASGGFKFDETASKTIRFARHGCANRPFYHIVVMMTRQRRNDHPIEQLGTYDPVPNEYNEKLVSLNIERIRYWIGTNNVYTSSPVKELFGLAGLYPLYHKTYMNAWRNRAKAEKEIEKLKNKQEEETRTEKEAAASS